MHTLSHPWFSHVSEPTGVVRAVVAVIWAVFLGVGASVAIPLPWTPVPITLQTLVLYTGAALLGRHFSLQMVLWYLALGGMGLPFFAGGTAGWSPLFGTTGGYLVGFGVAATWIGYWQPMVRSLRQQIFLFSTASGWLFACGVTWLALSMDISLSKALMAGFLPFIPGDILKIVMAAGLLSGWRRSCRCGPHDPWRWR